MFGSRAFSVSSSYPRRDARFVQAGREAKLKYLELIKKIGMSLWCAFFRCCICFVFHDFCSENFDSCFCVVVLVRFFAVTRLFVADTELKLLVKDVLSQRTKAQRSRSHSRRNSGSSVIGMQLTSKPSASKIEQSHGAEESFTLLLMSAYTRLEALRAAVVALGPTVEFLVRTQPAMESSTPTHGFHASTMSGSDDSENSSDRDKVPNIALRKASALASHLRASQLSLLASAVASPQNASALNPNAAMSFSFEAARIEAGSRAEFKHDRDLTTLPGMPS